MDIEKEGNEGMTTYQPSLNPLRRKKSEELKRMASFVDFAQGTVKVRKRRKKEVGPRKQPERALRAEVIKYLRKKGCKLWRVENSLPGYKGLPDLMLFTSVRGYNCYPPSRFFFLELKSDKGVLSKEQKEFKKHCELAGVGHIVARSVKDLEAVIK